jgi:hypothetical protein
MRSCLHGVPVSGRAAALFVSAAFLGTDMSRCWYHFYHRPEEVRRLNYCVYIIGDPASGKSFATRLYKLLAAPLIAADKVSNEAINRYKRERNERSTSSKEQKKEALKKPEVIVRVHGTRTANGVFIEDMNRAVDHVGQEEIHLHLLTFDAELDASTAASTGGQWIDKSTMELKAFHNEEDNQQYMNADSVSGPFNVYWNYVYTGTPLSLKRKVTEQNFGSGLSTRLACIPFPQSQFQMMELRRTSRVDHEADEEMKTWAYRLDGDARGELPLWPLLIKRVPYYGIAVSAPFIMMRHWEEWKKTGTFEVDDNDKALCELVLDMQYRCQRWFFGRYAENYFDNMMNESLQRGCRHNNRMQQAYMMLPETFTIEDIEKAFGVKNDNAKKICQRLEKEGHLERVRRGEYKKISKTI